MFSFGFEFEFQPLNTVSDRTEPDGSRHIHLHRSDLFVQPYKFRMFDPIRLIKPTIDRGIEFRSIVK